MITVFESPTLKSLKTNGESVPNVWQNRSLYFNELGSNLWMQSSSRYVKDRLGMLELQKDVDEIVKPLRDVPAFSYVSFGPGDCLKDRLIISQLPQIELYIPVDLSSAFLKRAYDQLSEIVPVAFVVSADFECDLPFIFETLSQIRMPKVISLLGNTLGNLDGFETKFVHALSAAMSTGDYFIFEVGIMKGDWDFIADSSSSVFYQDPLFRRFLINNLVQHTGEDVNELSAKFADRIKVKREDSELSSAVSYSIFDSESGNQVLRLTRYKWQELCRWFRDIPGLNVVYEHEHFYEELNLGTGIMLLQKV